MKAILCIAMILGPAAALAETTVQLAPVEQWSTVFGGVEAVFHYSITDEAPLSGRADWRLSANQRTVARGECPFEIAAGDTVTIEIRLPIPKVAQGVVFPVTLAISVLGNAGKEPVVTEERNLWVFSRDPFLDKRTWLETLQLRLFDPEAKTAERLEEAGVPFEPVNNIETLQSVTNGILIIGEDVSFQDFRGLPSAMVSAAQRGVPVLCLAPSGGEFTLPGTGDAERLQPRGLRFCRADIIKVLDKRLDDVAWPPEGHLASHSLKLRGDRGPVAVEIIDEVAGWSWVEARFDEIRGRLVVCSFLIIKQWEASPTPRYLLTALLEYVNRDEKKNQEQEGDQR